MSVCPADRFHGIAPALATPFTADHALDLARLPELVEHYIAAGVHGLSVAGSQGEFFALSEREWHDLVTAAARAVNGRKPLYVGTGAITTAESISLTRAAADAGADVAMVITPYFISPSADELVAHYEAILDAAPIPVMLYNNPPRTGVNLTPRVYGRLLGHERLIGIKDSSGDMTQLAEFIRMGRRQEERMGGRGHCVFAGRDTLILATVIEGGAGSISPAANVFPRLVTALYDAARAGRIDEARRLSDVLAPLRLAWELGSFPVVIKEAMTLVGMSAGPARSPIRALPETARAELTQVIDRIRAFEEHYSRTTA